MHSTFIDGNLDAVSGEIVKGELDRLCEQIRLQDHDDGLPPARVPDPDDPNGWIRVDEFRRRPAA